MRALVVVPGTANSARVEHVPDPPVTDGSVLVRTLAVGVCGTDREIVSGDYGWLPPGKDHLILGHESLGIVEDAPPGSGLARQDLVVGIVRRPDPVPCLACGVGEWDMCSNGRYTERGIKERDGYASEYFRIEPDFTIKVDPALGTLGVLLEPMSIIAKAWDHVERIGERSRAWRPRRLLVTGAGTIGLLAALCGAQRKLDVHVFDRASEGLKPILVRELGATYHSGQLADLAELAPDIVMECTGAPAVVRDIIGQFANAGIVCFAGLSTAGHPMTIDVGRLNHTMVLANCAMFGTVNANRRHYEAGAQNLARARPEWLTRLLSRRVPLDAWAQALGSRLDDIKTVIDFTL